MRTGLTTVGLPGAQQGIQPEDPTLAELLKPQGYLTAQIGKNHLGDRNEFLPTVHGFDEFYGNLYHLNAEEEPEQPDYPKDLPIFQQFFMPRGVLECKATDVDDPTEDPRFGRVGKQTITDTGPLTRKRMETVEDDLLERSLDFIDRAHAGRRSRSCCGTTPPACTSGPTSRSGGRTRPAWASTPTACRSWTGSSGELLDKLDELGIADNTIVVFSQRQRRREVHLARRWHVAVPGREGSRLGGWLPGAVRRSAGPARSPPGRCSTASSRWRTSCRRSWPRPASRTSRSSCSRATTPGDKHFRVHLDGYNQLPYLTGEVEESPRHEFFYYGEHDLFALRYNNWKVHFLTKDDWFAGAMLTTDGAADR